MVKFFALESPQRGFRASDFHLPHSNGEDSRLHILKSNKCNEQLKTPWRMPKGFCLKVIQPERRFLCFFGIYPIR